MVSSISGLILFLSHSFQETPKVYQFTRTPFRLKQQPGGRLFPPAARFATQRSADPGRSPGLRPDTRGWDGCSQGSTRRPSWSRWCPWRGSHGLGRFRCVCWTSKWRKGKPLRIDTKTPFLEGQHPYFWYMGPCTKKWVIFWSCTEMMSVKSIREALPCGVPNIQSFAC